MSYAASTTALFKDAGHKPPAAPTSFNGARGEIDIVSPQQFIAPENKIVINGQGIYDLRCTVAYHVKYYCEANNRPKLSELGEQDMELMLDAAGVRIAQFELLALLVRSLVEGENKAPEFRTRSSDVIRADAFVASFTKEGPVLADCLRMADIMIAGLSTPEAAIHLKFARYVTVTLVGNAFHRHHVDGHNFMTGSINDGSTFASKIPAFLGQDRDQYSKFLKVWGHDLWHFLPNDVMEQFAYIMVGETAAVINKDVKHSSQDVSGLYVHDVLSLSESVTDRYPPGTIGTSSMVLGMGFIKSMFTSIFYRANSSEASKVSTLTDHIASQIGHQNFSRADVLRLRDAFAPLIAFALGYASASAMTRDNVDKHSSFKTFMNNYNAEVMNGTTYAKIIAELDIDPNSVGMQAKSLLDLLATASESFDRIANNNGFEASPETSRIDKDSTDVATMSTKEVGKRRAAAVEAKRMLDSANMSAEEADYW